jgi:hypothetical protein
MIICKAKIYEKRVQLIEILKRYGICSETTKVFGIIIHPKALVGKGDLNLLVCEKIDYFVRKSIQKELTSLFNAKVKIYTEHMLLTSTHKTGNIGYKLPDEPSAIKNTISTAMLLDDVVTMGENIMRDASAIEKEINTLGLVVLIFKNLRGSQEQREKLTEYSQNYSHIRSVPPWSYLGDNIYCQLSTEAQQVIDFCYHFQDKMKKLT